MAFVLITYGWFLGALVVFGLASLTDALDGYFARLLNQTSALGRQLDPLVDKLVIVGDPDRPASRGPRPAWRRGWSR